METAGLIIPSSDRVCTTFKSDTYLSNPYIFLTPEIPLPNNNDCDCDCDCLAQTTQLTNTSTIHWNTPYHLAPLHQQSLGAGYTVLFQPRTNRGIAVVNQATLELLERFRTPRTLQEGIAPLPLPDAALETVAQLANLGLLEPLGTQFTFQKNPPDQLTAWIHVTNDCNLDCTYCYIAKSPDDMSLEQGQWAVQAVFRSAGKHNFRRIRLKYAGGEATLNIALVLQLHRYAQTLGDESGVTVEGVVLTNGVGVPRWVLQKLQQEGIRLAISLDGIESANGQRVFRNGSSSFVAVEHTLDRCRSLGYVPTITVTISQDNAAHLAPLIRFLRGRELPFTLNFFRDNDCVRSAESLRYEESAMIAGLKAAFHELERDLPPYSLLAMLTDRTRLDAMHDQPCGVGTSYMVINQKGGIAKCHMFIEQTVTDVHSPDPLGIIQLDQIGIQNPTVDTKIGCSTCTWRYHCAGGCPAVTYRATGRYDLQSPNCHIYQTIFPEVIRLEGLRLLKMAQPIKAE